MKELKEYLQEQEELQEALITFGGKAYPAFNQIVAIVGSAGSGKSFLVKSLVGIEGKVLDEDAMKSMILKNSILSDIVKERTNKDISKLQLKNPDDVGALHLAVEDSRLQKGKDSALFKSLMAAPPERKPNLIFDVTMKDLTKLAKIRDTAKALGYQQENIHIVWVMNDYEVAAKQNKSLDRVVPEEILLVTHEGAARTMADIFDQSSTLTKTVKGDIWIAFNKEGIDTEVKSSQIGDKHKKKDYFKIKKDDSDVGAYVLKSYKILVKKRGSSKINLPKDAIEKILDYTPKGVGLDATYKALDKKLNK